MLCAVDIGNSNIVIGMMASQSDIRFSGRIRTDRKMTREEFMIQLKNLMEIYHMSFSEIDGVIISSVVPEVTDLIRAGMEILTGCTPFVVGLGIKTGIRIATDHPASLGSDLVVDAVAATEEYKEPLIVFDMGTATTCSVIVEKKTYLGTLILPGVRISQDALKEKTSQLPYIRFDKPKALIGRNTIESMQSGLIYGNASMIDGLIERIEETIGKKATVLMTGGIAGQIIPFCHKEVIYDPNLLLKGLWYIYRKNIK